MEAALLMVDVIAMVMVCYWCVKNDGWKPGESASGLFRFREVKPNPPASPLPVRPPPIRPARR